MGYGATKDYYQKVLKKCHPTARERIVKKLQDANECKGRTILDMIIDVILDTDDSGH